MRNARSSGLFAVVLLGGLAVGGCGDDSSDPNSSVVPGVSTNAETNVDTNTGGTGDDLGVGETSLPALTDPQMTPAPNPNAGAGGGEVDTGSVP